VVNPGDQDLRKKRKSGSLKRWVVGKRKKNGNVFTWTKAGDTTRNNTLVADRKAKRGENHKKHKIFQFQRFLRFVALKKERRLKKMGKKRLG